MKTEEEYTSNTEESYVGNPDLTQEELDELQQLTKAQQALLDFLDQDRPIILNWENKVALGAKTFIEIDPEQSFTTIQTTFNLDEFDYKVLEECQKGLECFFVFKGQKFLFEMGIDPKKLMVDNGAISVFEMTLKNKPVVLRFIQIINE